MIKSMPGARQRQPEVVKPVKDAAAYQQFMNQTGANLGVEAANTATIAEARRKDALITGEYEQKRINDLAAWERTQVQNSLTGIGGASRSSRARYANSSSNAAVTNSPAMQAVEYRRQAGIALSQDNVDSRLQDNQALARARNEALVDTADNLRDQILSTQSSSKSFGLQGVGTNLYVRQYVKPETKLPPVHGAAARIVPAGSF